MLLESPLPNPSKLQLNSQSLNSEGVNMTPDYNQQQKVLKVEARIQPRPLYHIPNFSSDTSAQYTKVRLSMQVQGEPGKVGVLGSGIVGSFEPSSRGSQPAGRVPHHHQLLSQKIKSQGINRRQTRGYTEGGSYPLKSSYANERESSIAGRSIDNQERMEMERNALQKLKDMDSHWGSQTGIATGGGVVSGDYGAKQRQQQQYLSGYHPQGQDDRLAKLMSLKEDVLLLGIKIKKGGPEKSRSPPHTEFHKLAKQQFTVTEESEERLQQSSQKLKHISKNPTGNTLHLQNTTTNPLNMTFSNQQTDPKLIVEPIRKLEITLQNANKISLITEVPFQDSKKQKKIMLQDKIKVREVLRTVEEKQKELMSISFYSKNKQLQEQEEREQQHNAKNQQSQSQSKQRRQLSPVQGKSASPQNLQIAGITQSSNFYQPLTAAGTHSPQNANKASRLSGGNQHQGVANSMTVSATSRPSHSTKASNKLRLKPILGQQLDLQMKSKAEINGMRLQYFKQRDNVYNQYLVQHQISQKEKALESLLKKAGVQLTIDQQGILLQQITPSLEKQKPTVVGEGSPLNNQTQRFQIQLQSLSKQQSRLNQDISNVTQYQQHLSDDSLNNNAQEKIPSFSPTPVPAQKMPFQIGSPQLALLLKHQIQQLNLAQEGAAIRLLPEQLNQLDLQQLAQLQFLQTPSASISIPQQLVLDTNESDLALGRDSQLSQQPQPLLVLNSSSDPRSTAPTDLRNLQAENSNNSSNLEGSFVKAKTRLLNQTSGNFEAKAQSNNKIYQLDYQALKENASGFNHLPPLKARQPSTINLEFEGGAESQDRRSVGRESSTLFVENGSGRASQNLVLMSNYKKPNAFQKFSMSPKRVDRLSMPSTKREPDNLMIIKMIRRKFVENQMKGSPRRQAMLIQDKSEDSPQSSPMNKTSETAAFQLLEGKQLRNTLKTFQHGRDPQELRSYIEQEKDMMIRNFLLSQVSPRQYQEERRLMELGDSASRGEASPLNFTDHLAKLPKEDSQHQHAHSSATHRHSRDIAIKRRGEIYEVNGEIKYNDCEKLDGFLAKYNQFKFLEAVSGAGGGAGGSLLNKKDLVFKKEINGVDQGGSKRIRPKLLSDSDFNLFFKKK